MTERVLTSRLLEKRSNRERSVGEGPMEKEGLKVDCWKSCLTEKEGMKVDSWKSGSNTT